MSTFESIFDLVHEGCLMTSLDLKDPYMLCQNIYVFNGKGGLISFVAFAVDCHQLQEFSRKF